MRKNWNTYNYLAFWACATISVPTFSAVMVSLSYGLSPWQTFINVMLGNIIALVPIVLYSYLGGKHSKTSSQFAKATFGKAAGTGLIWLRIIAGILWLAVQAYTFGKLFPLFIILVAVLALFGQKFIRIINGIAGPLLALLLLFSIVWAYGTLSHDLHFFDVMALGYKGSLVTASGGLLKCFFITLITNWAYWILIAFTIPDFSRLSKIGKYQIWGHIAGFLGSTCLLTFAGIYFAQATRIKNGTIIYNPLDIVFANGGPALAIAALIFICSAVTCANICAMPAAWEISTADKRLKIIEVLILVLLMATAWLLCSSTWLVYSIINWLALILAILLVIIIGYQLITKDQN